MFGIELPDDTITSLKEASYDDANKMYLVNNLLEVWKVDDYNKIYYNKQRNSGTTLKGSDACFECNGILYIIEFKNCPLDSKLSYEVQEKMYDTSIVVMDKLHLSISEFRDKAKFVLVYSFKKNINKEKTQQIEQCTSEFSPSLQKIKTNLRSKGSYKIKDFNKYAFRLRKLEHYLYQEVSAIPDEYFEAYLEQEEIM